ncbi:maleylpyruvate isomerase family mycothiol-dependent enzyme [Arthrobacter jiangjiafuii]|uniref:Maleylpyruvate isomerase family mycothiol-dependent enzyme n=1 Tax=Arthrobacter jiangjiafuii TaxID=2817475 RepID=A0A975R0P8_9MICC|nr:maleylpyruvate isomerase family mycothiol-dependent enzyme [Arthrobacter jiangjiafuii]MBP3044180.1 maleylpyruvate isomerase family mycothiol-dependent enzyme [Arthrobacter jiangjiafuii]QWC11150.1 maleylpyruvate isomerase family mycothiol-dependent enzyme [Arthrobacter jiangjiafuii]
MTGLPDVPGSAVPGSAPASSVPKPGPRPGPEQLVSLLDEAASAFREHLVPLTDADVRAPSGLPGWSRGHVLAHVAGVADGMARQLEYAAAGETIDLYDGGVDGRNRAIEEGSVRSADRQRADLDTALDRALAAFHRLGESDWDVPISYRDGIVRDGGLALWRELVIHLTDLNVGVEADAWTPLFCEHLFGFLAARVPSDLRLSVQPFGMAPRILASTSEDAATAATARSRTVSVNGMATDIAAWLAGRNPNLGSLRAEAAADGVELPALLPWPSALPAK